MTTNKAERHRSRMQKKKEIVDAAIARADQDKGLLVLLTGNGKGKSSSAFGMAARALGHGMHVAVAQFIKGSNNTGEEAFFRNQEHVTWHVLGDGFTWETQNLERDKATANQGWNNVRNFLRDESIHLVILDELTYPIKFGWLDINTVLSDLNKRPKMQHVVITGRGAVPALIEAADTVSELNDVKHAFREGIRAQQGIDL